MRTITLALVLATFVAFPAVAERGDREGHRGDRGRSSQSGAVVQQRSEAPQRRSEPRAAIPREDFAVRNQAERGQYRGDRGQYRGEQGQYRGERRDRVAVAPVIVAPAAVAPVTVAPRARDRSVERTRPGGWSHNGSRQQSDERIERRPDDRGRDRDHRRWDDNDRANQNWHRDRNASRHRNDHNWTRNWRNDNRYNWQHNRSRYHDRYRLGRYTNPFGYGYGYNRFSIGIYIDSRYFGRSYWLDDPWDYRLPPAPYGCRWIRYYDDVVLVDMRNGYVLDVIEDFFW